MYEREWNVSEIEYGYIDAVTADAVAASTDDGDSEEEEKEEEEMVTTNLYGSTWHSKPPEWVFLTHYGNSLMEQ